jgi:hypothetical protein
MRTPLILVLALVLLPVGARAQLSVRLNCDRDTFLLYEAVPVQVVIQNLSGRPLQLAGSGEKPWLNFIITDAAGSIVAAASKPATDEPMLVAPGQAAARTVNLLPLYELRSHGSYTVRASVETDSLKAMSAPVRLIIINGREIWTQTVGLPAAEGQSEEYRAYSVLVRRGDRYDSLYIGVKDPSKGLVYGMLPLGTYIAMGEPEIRTDKAGHLHVLYRNASRSFGYVHVDPNANVIERAAFSELQSRPLLAMDADGSVSVVGGEKVFPRAPGVGAERPAPLAPPEPPLKQKGRTPVGKRRATRERPAETNAPSQNFAPR